MFASRKTGLLFPERARVVLMATTSRYGDVYVVYFVRYRTASWPRARAAPRYGVPSVMSLRVISAPPHCSMYQRAISPPIEWHANTTSASA